jgi:predicted patatin/cPLA2 family phospholipase
LRGLVISGGGSKGAFAGGITDYLINQKSIKWDILLGTSTGSLLIPHLCLSKTKKLKKIYTNVSQQDIFSLDPFVIRSKKDQKYVTINYINTITQFIKKRRTFGESKNLRKTIEKKFTVDEFLNIKKSSKDIIVTVSNLTKNKIEYKSIKDFEYQDFLDWIWISCNMIPFMSLVSKDGYKYADGGFGSMVPIRECIRRGATEIDVVILETETCSKNKVLGKNPFDLMINLFTFMVDQVEINDIREGKLAAMYNGVKLNLYYTPVSLTNNSLIFDKNNMEQWWKDGFDYAKNRFNI